MQRQGILLSEKCGGPSNLCTVLRDFDVDRCVFGVVLLEQLPRNQEGHHFSQTCYLLFEINMFASH